MLYLRRENERSGRCVTQQEDAISKRSGTHDYLLRIPDESWEQFNALVEALRPKRSVNQQIVHLIEEFVRTTPAERIQPAAAGDKKARP